MALFLKKIFGAFWRFPAQNVALPNSKQLDTLPIEFFFKIALSSLILTHCEFPQTRSEWNLNNGQIGGGGTPAAAGMMFAIPIAPIVVTNTSAAALMTNHGLMPTDLMENTGSKMSQANNVQHSNHFQHHQQQQQHPHHTVG